MSTGQRELKLCEEYDCQDVTHALISKYDALLKSWGRGGGGGGRKGMNDYPSPKRGVYTVRGRTGPEAYSFPLPPLCVLCV